MAKLIIGNTGTPVTAAFVRDMSPAHYIEKTVDANGKLVNDSSNFINLTGVTDIGNYALASAYQQNSFLSDITNFGDVIRITGTSALKNAFDSSSVTNVNFYPVKSITGSSCLSYTFFSCSSLNTVNLDSVTTISTALEETFNNSSLVSCSMNGLNTITTSLGVAWGQPFSTCKKLENVYFGGLTASTFANRTDQIAYLFNATTGSQATNGCTVHFPSNFDPSDPTHTFDASTLTGYPTFNGNASYIHVAFDLPATE